MSIRFVFIVINTEMSVIYIPRVTQLDAVQLDDEVVELFKQQLMESTRYFYPGFLTPMLPELEILLRSLLFKYSLATKCQTFGQKMLSLKYNNDAVSRSKLCWYYGYTIGMKYLRDRANNSFTSNRKIQNIVNTIEKVQTIAEILNFLRFIQSGKCPTFIDYLLNLEVSSKKTSQVNLNDFSWSRELLWNNFIELFGTIISLASILNWKTKLSYLLRLMGKQKRMGPATAEQPNSLALDTVCAACDERPILPHHMGCAHTFCFYCLQTNKLADEHYSCPKCNYVGDGVVKLIT